MIDAMPMADIIALLRAGVESGALPASAERTGGKLLARLTSPIRVAVLGHPNSGKSQLLNILAGEAVIPDGTRLPTFELVWGEERAMTMHFVDGETERRTEFALDKIRRRDIELIRVEAPIPILKKISLLEVVTRGNAEDEREGVVWAAERADIVLWCSQEFSPAEQWLWSAMPDRLKDHGFLVLTKADVLIREKRLQAVIDKSSDIVAEEFHSLVPIATLQGLKAMAGEGGAESPAFAASGARALVTAILRHVEQGRRADLDGAMLFLSHFGKLLPKEALNSVATAAPAVPAAPVDVAPGAPSRAAFAAAYEYLNDAAANLNRDVDATDAEAVLQHCVATSDSLLEMVSDIEPDAGFRQAHDDIHEASEMMLLMQLERGEGPAADAATLLLQLRRSLAQALAA